MSEFGGWIGTCGKTINGTAHFNAAAIHMSMAQNLGSKGPRNFVDLQY